jgi:hypothetical protein
MTEAMVLEYKMPTLAELHLHSITSRVISSEGQKIV